MGYKHLNIDERESILKMLSEAKNMTQIAERLGRNKGTISRELSRNRSSTGEYKPHLGQRYYRKRRAESKQPYRFEQRGQIPDRRSIDQRPRIVNERKRLMDYPECIVTVSLPKIIGGQASDIEFEISGDELTTLDQLALKSQELADKTDGFRDSDTTVRIGKPELRIRPRRAVLADLGMPAIGLGVTLRANLEGLEAGVCRRNYSTCKNHHERCFIADLFWVE